MFRRGRGFGPGRGGRRHHSSGRNSDYGSNNNSNNNNSNSNGNNPDDNPNNNGPSTTTQLTDMSAKIASSVLAVIVIIIFNGTFIAVFSYYLFGVETEVDCYAIEGSQMPVTDETQYGASKHVSKQFNILMWIYFYGHCIDAIS